MGAFQWSSAAATTTTGTQQPGMQQPGMGAQQVKQDSSPLTVFILCNPTYSSNANPVVFAPNMNYRTRTNGYMFVLESAAGCPANDTSTPAEPTAEPTVWVVPGLQRTVYFEPRGCHDTP